MASFIAIMCCLLLPLTVRWVPVSIDDAAAANFDAALQLTTSWHDALFNFGSAAAAGEDTSGGRFDSATGGQRDENGPDSNLLVSASAIIESNISRTDEPLNYLVTYANNRVANGPVVNR